MEAEPLLLAVGVKMAVRVRPLPLRAERVPPETLMSVLVKEVPGSRVKRKVISAVSPTWSAALSLLMRTAWLAVPLRLVVAEARKKAARSLVDRERMSPKPALSAPFTLV